MDNKKLDNKDENQKQEPGNILQFTSLSLFDEDPLAPDFSFIDSDIEVPKHTLHLLQGEELLSDTHFIVHLDSDRKKLRGGYELLITNYRLIFYEISIHTEKIKKIEINEEYLSQPISIPYGFMEEVDIEKKEIVIKMKTGLTNRLRSNADINSIYQTILHGFTCIPFFEKQIYNEESSNYDCLAEVERMRIVWERFIIIPNTNGKLCSTYPKYFIISKGISQNLIEQCLKARNLGRIPVLTYYYDKYNSGLWRAARPKINQQHNKYNKAYLKQIHRNILIFDFRDEELNSKDKQQKSILLRKFETISNILIAYAKEESILKLIGRWFEQISYLIACSYRVVEYLQSPDNQVLLQQNFGFDRVCQISSLVQIILDPYYRTIQGFNLLIEKQFISFGHPFARRLGFERQKMGQSSPIFIQFLQCVNQLIITHPGCFEFSSFYLARIGYETYSTKYNNFFYNMQKQRINSKYFNKTATIQKNMPMRKQFYNYQWIQKEASQALVSVRRPPSVKQFLVWRQFYDLVTEMKCQYPDQQHTKKRRSSLYKIIQRRNSRQV